MSDRESNAASALASFVGMASEGASAFSEEAEKTIDPTQAPWPVPADSTATYRPAHGGHQYKFRFHNGRGASVIRHRYSYGYEDGLWELAVLNAQGNLDYTTEITDDVIGRLTPGDVARILERIAAL